MPDRRFRMFGREHSLNPGKFNKKEHMLIAIMANTAKSLPYTQYIVWTQVLPQYFNQQYARNFGYQILIVSLTTSSTHTNRPSNPPAKSPSQPTSSATVWRA